MALTDSAQRLQEVERRLAEACARSGRSREDINIIAVTKYVSVDTAAAAISAGVRHIGENRWPDAREKWEALRDRAKMHFIGTLQTNKAKEVVGRFDYIHSLDRLSLAEELERQAQKRGIDVACFLQVNVSGESSKHGFPPEQFPDIARGLARLPHVKPIGLMTMAPLDSDAESARPVFRALRELRDEWNEAALLERPLTELSMGMSGDFETAVEEGATWVRLGTVLVGNER